MRKVLLIPVLAVGAAMLSPVQASTGFNSDFSVYSSVSLNSAGELAFGQGNLLADNDKLPPGLEKRLNEAREDFADRLQDRLDDKFDRDDRDRDRRFDRDRGPDRKFDRDHRPDPKFDRDRGPDRKFDRDHRPDRKADRDRRPDRDHRPDRDRRDRD